MSNKLNTKYNLKIFCPQCNNILLQQNTNDAPLVVCNDYEGDKETYVRDVIEYSGKDCRHIVFIKYPA